MEEEKELQPDSSPAEAGLAQLAGDAGPPQPPPGIVVASNGVWRDEKTGKFVPGGKNSYAITEENSYEYQRRWQQKKAEGILLAEKRLGAVSPDYWGDIAESFYNLAMGEKGGIAAVQAGRMVGEMTGYLGSNGKDRSDQVPSGGARVELGAEAVARLLEFIAESRE